MSLHIAVNLFYLSCEFPFFHVFPFASFSGRARAMDWIEPLPLPLPPSSTTRRRAHTFSVVRFSPWLSFGPIIYALEMTNRQSNKRSQSLSYAARTFARSTCVYNVHASCVRFKQPAPHTNSVRVFRCPSIALRGSIQFLCRSPIHACLHNPRDSLSIISFSTGKRRRRAATSADKNTHFRPENDIICVHFDPRYVRPESDRNPSLSETREIRSVLDIGADEWDAASRRAIDRVIIFPSPFALIQWELCEQMLLSSCLTSSSSSSSAPSSPASLFYSHSAHSPLSTTPNMVKKRLQFPASKWASMWRAH